MRSFVFVLPFAVAALALVGCKKDLGSKSPTGVTVSATDTARGPSDESRLERAPLDDRTAETPLAMPGAGPEPSWVPKLRQVCQDVEEPDSKGKDERATKDSEGWKGKLDIKVTDFHIYSPVFKKWTLEKVDDRTKLNNVRRRGAGWYGFGLAVEAENKSDEVLVGDDIYVWATFQSRAGETHCFASGETSRSWNPFAKKGAGAWVTEKDMSEWPLRPKERKRYIVTRTNCMTEMFTEAEPSAVDFEIYARFRPLGGDVVVAGPFKTLKRDGGLLRGQAIAESDRGQSMTEGKNVKAVTALFAASDHVLVAEGKKSRWVPAGVLRGNTPDTPPKTEPLPDSTPDLSKTYESLTLKVSEWSVKSWRDFGGELKQGHKMLQAKVEVSVDTSSVEGQLKAAVSTANDKLTEAQTDLATKEAAMTTAQTALEAAAGTDDEAGAKTKLAEAKTALEDARKAVTDAEKGVKAADKALTGGVGAFLKNQVKAVDCGSFAVDAGYKALKPFKGSFGKKDCAALTRGEAASGTLSYDLARWDMPFVLTWKGAGGVLETHIIASQALAKILRD